ncbi:MAG: respiratory nitrate reductase subunit gamma [Deltaproteobacteria bacterium]|nr:respiratory nitrate reductase subunit gamma [Deltaproteobacteria bacterium]
MMTSLHSFLFIALPYLTMGVFLVGTFYRYKVQSFKVSSLSSQFLENEKLFWGSTAFHVGMMAVLCLHLIAFLFPRTLLAWNSYPIRLILLEVTGFVFALSFLAGLILLFVRRIYVPRIRVVTQWTDLLIEVLLLFQITLGCVIAVLYRWGSSWFASDLSPYLWSLVRLNPDLQTIIAMPEIVQAHVVGAFLILLVFPFTRLIHSLVAPLHYLWRPYQQVIWLWDRKRVRDTRKKWSEHLPKNT